MSNNPEAQILNEIAQLQQSLIGGKGFLTRTVAEGYDAARAGNGLFGGGGANRALDAGNDAPWISPPHGAYPFFPKLQVPLPAVGLTSVVLTLVVPNGVDGAIRKFSNNFVGGGFVNGSGNIIWRILVDGRAARNADNIISEMGTQDLPFELSMPIRVYSGQVIEFTVTHFSNAALSGDVLCLLEGYFYPARGG